MMNILGSRNTKQLISNVLIFILYVLILTFVLRFLWNRALVQHISILRPTTTLLDTFVLAVAFSMFRM
jgi:hypothetical protein